MQAAKSDYYRCCKNELGKDYVSLFGEKIKPYRWGEGIDEDFRKYENINVVEEDLDVVSTKLCRAWLAWYSLVRSIMEK